MRWGVPVAGLAAAGLAVVTAGVEPFGRLALRAGLPSLAVPLLSDPAMRGVALMRSGQHEAAAEAFTEAGPSQTYNRATALALGGDYAEALLTYDDLLAREPDHGDGQANFALLLAVYGGTELHLTFDMREPEKRDGPIIEGPDAQAGARAQGTGAEADGLSTDLFAPDVTSGQGLRVVPKVFDDVFIAASDTWLETMLDQPGKYLSARMRAEQKRRRAAGIAVPEETGAW